VSTSEKQSAHRRCRRRDRPLAARPPTGDSHVCPSPPPEASDHVSTNAPELCREYSANWSWVAVVVVPSEQRAVKYRSAPVQSNYPEPSWARQLAVTPIPSRIITCRLVTQLIRTFQPVLLNIAERINRLLTWSQVAPGVRLSNTQCHLHVRPTRTSPSPRRADECPRNVSRPARPRA
jgi:hypothetical protein